jgi:hypothetical protein
LKNLNDAE